METWTESIVEKFDLSSSVDPKVLSYKTILPKMEKKN